MLMLAGPDAGIAQGAAARPGWTSADIDLFEVNEAFAAVPLAFIEDLGVTADKVNVNGGAIALGHPLGATGAMLLGTVLDALEDRRLEHRAGDPVHRRRHGHRHHRGAGVMTERQ